jgi:Dolichyl-phosphate-mannose-protein mannosyltransferase
MLLGGSDSVLGALPSQVFHSTAVRLFFLAFIVYNVNLRSVTSLDTYPTRFLPISIIKEFNLDLDEFPFLHHYPVWLQSDTQQEPAYYVRKTHGHYMSNYPVMPAILSVPVYFVPVLLGLIEGPVSATGLTRTEIVGTFLAKISASAAVAFSVGILYLTLLRLTSKTAALWIALIYAFATSSWSISSQGLWQTAMSQPLLALTLYYFVRARGNRRYIIYAGMPLALSVACRPPTIIFAVAFLSYVIWYHRAQFLAFMVFPVVLGGLLLTHNLYYFGNLEGGYTAMGTRELFSYPHGEALLGLLISPSRGLLVYSPVLLFACAGLGSVLHRCRQPVLTFTATATVSTVLFYSTWGRWDGAFSFSYRFLVDVLPAMGLFLAEIWNWIVAKHWRKGLFAVSVVFSILIQIIGSFFYPCGWYDTPVTAKIHRERFWDWKDPEFLRCLRAGPVTPDGIQLILKGTPQE